MIVLSEIDDQALSTLVCNQLICQSCGVIDRDYTRLMKGHRCTTCSAEGEAGHLVFPLNVHILVDLVQQSFHSTCRHRQDGGPQDSDIGTIIYYCTLREALLNSFLVDNLRARSVPETLIRKLLEDNKLASQKFGGLFSSTVGAKWDEAVSQISSRTGFDFMPVSKLMRNATEFRNEFLHEGRAWALTRAFATECIDSLGDLVALFAELHNEYTHPLLRAANPAKHGPPQTAG